MEIRGFNSPEEMFVHLERLSKSADAHVQPWQAALKPGDFLRRSSGHGSDIYEEILANEGAEAPKDCRLSRCCLVACPEGEPGEVHISTIEAVPPLEPFEAAQLQEWFP